MTKELKTLKELEELEGKERIDYIREYQDELEEIHGKALHGLLSMTFEPAVYGDEKDADQELSKLGINPRHKSDYGNQLFETNHARIVSFIKKFLMEYASFPQVALIADHTMLSRTTIYKHLSHLDDSRYRDIMSQKVKVMRDSILGKLYFEALNNRDMKAAGLYLKYTQGNSGVNTPVTNNYIQINSIKLSQETLEELPSSSIIEIEEIIKKSLLEIEKVNKGEQNHKQL